MRPARPPRETDIPAKETLTPGRLKLFQRARVCAACGALAAAWSARCGKCRAFDALAWTAPPRVAPTVAPTALEAPTEATDPPALAAPKEDTKAGLPAVTGTAAP